MDMIGFWFFPMSAHRARHRPRRRPEGLWKLGLSGDMPIVCAELRREEQYPLAEVLLRRHACCTPAAFPSILSF
jgi:hypothetical protein